MNIVSSSLPENDLFAMIMSIGKLRDTPLTDQLFLFNRFLGGDSAKLYSALSLNFLSTTENYGSTLAVVNQSIIDLKQF